MTHIVLIQFQGRCGVTGKQVVPDCSQDLNTEASNNYENAFKGTLFCTFK